MTSPPSPIDTLNRFGVACSSKGVTLLLAPRRGEVFSPDEALQLAAHLVAISEHQAAHTFAEVLEAVMAT